jgi:transposase
VQLRYNFRLDPTPGQQAALARAFGCARWVYNAALAARKASYEAGGGWIPGAVLSKRLITEAKKNPATAFLSEVSAVVLQQALRDCDMACRNFFESAKGNRTGERVGEPRFRSRRDARQAIRFTSNARFKVTPGGEPSGLRRGSVRGRARAHPAGEVRARRGLVQFRGHAGVQGRPVRAGVREDRPVRAHLAGLFGLWREGRPGPLSVREWRCGGCGTTHDREVNAAKNVLELGKQQVAAGCAETLKNACGGQVRPGLVPAPADEAGTRRSERAGALR